MTDLDALLDAAVERRTAAPNTETVEVLLGENLWFLRFTELDSKDWTRITASSPWRADVPLDMHYGYNYHDATEKAAPISGVRLVDGEPEILTPEQWAKVFLALDSSGRVAVTDAIFKLNEFDPAQRVARAKKALLAAQKQKRPSLAN